MAENSKVTAYEPMWQLTSDYQPYSGTTPFPGFHGLHCHDFFEFYIYFSGAPSYCLDNQAFPLTTCTLVICPPFHLHGPTGQKTDDEYIRAWLYISPATVRSAGMGMHDLNGFFKSCVDSGRGFINITLEQGEKLRSLIEDVRDHMDSQSPVRKWQNDLRVALFLSEVYDIVSNAGESSTPTTVNSAIQPVLVYINDHFTEKISIAELSREFGISASHMAREFSAYTGRSVYDYVLYRRILLAKEKIYLGKPFSEIAFECGFNDYSNFLRAFTKLAGQTPSEYKKYVASIGDIV